MPKVKISGASQKPSDHRDKMEAKPRCESPRVEFRKPAFAETMALYTALQSGDPIDSILNRLIVAMTNTVMQSHGRALETRNPQAIDINLRHAVKGTKAVIELIEAKTRRRGSNQITVGKVNVEAGGQAIVGNVDARKTRRPETRDCCDPPRDHIEETDD